MKQKKATKKSISPPKKIEEIAEVEESVPATKSRRPWYIALLVVGLIVLVASTALAVTEVLADWERRIFDVVNHAYLPSWVAEQIAKPVSNAVWGIVILVVALLAVPKFRLLAWQYAVAGGSTYVGMFIVEHVVTRARPVGLASYEVVARSTSDGLGFPSTHVGILAALVLAVWPFLAWPWRILLVLFVGAEAWARIFLGLHAPLDVVGGVAVAMVAVATLHLVPAKVRSFCKLGA